MEILCSRFVAPKLRAASTCLPMAETGAVINVGELPTVLADIVQLQRLFQNLIGNSLKFRADDRPPRVSVSARRDGAFWVFAVTDNGIGIENVPFRNVKPLEKIFELGVISRLHTGKRYGDKYPGSGVGLSTCKLIVERHGGRIWASSPGADQGMTITFTLRAA